MKIAILVLLVLLSAILAYPPFYWNYQGPKLESIIQDQLPIKKHAMIFGPSTQKFTLKHYPEPTGSKDGPQSDASLEEKMRDYSDEELERSVGIIPLKRSIAFVDLSIEILLAFTLSAFIGIVFGRKRTSKST